jgi:hypothetical protein
MGDVADLRENALAVRMGIPEEIRAILLNVTAPLRGKKWIFSEFPCEIAFCKNRRLTCVHDLHILPLIVFKKRMTPWMLHNAQHLAAHVRAVEANSASKENGR